jgi:EPS-associated MarR family transcriptional regulator
VEISVGSVHYLLSALVDKGLVKLRNFSTAKDKRRYAYILTPKGALEKAALTGRFLRRKFEEFEVLKAGIKALQEETEGYPEMTLSPRK